MNDKYQTGSEWRKWDLHVHTPLSIIQNYGGNNSTTWEKYINDLENLSDEYAVIGINDYLFLDGYKKLVDEQKNNSRLQKVTLFPVLEFRIEQFAGVDFENLKRINLHVIFSNELSIETIESQFLNTLSQSYTLETDGKAWTRAITRESVAELGKNIKDNVPEDKLCDYGSDLAEGFNNLNVKKDEILASLKKDCFKDKYLIAIGKTEWADLKWSDSSVATKKSIINEADIVFTSAESVEAFEKSKNQLTNQNVNDLLLDCSDAHDFSESSEKDRIGNCFTWIKADPTFEGLKQILHEPAERIYIGEKPTVLNRVENNKTKYIHSLNITKDDTKSNIDTWFDNISISFNKELVAIIGNKGSGKSGIADILGLLGDTHTSKEHFSFLHKNKFLKGKLASNFSGQICWESGGSSDKVKLDSELNDGKPESVRFIPQNYFEELTNEIEISKFQQVLENIIFKYIPYNERLGKTNFKELEAYKTTYVNQEIQGLINEFRNLNEQIIDLEKRKYPDYLKKIEGFISQRKLEIQQQRDSLNKLPDIKKPNNDSKPSTEKIIKLNKNLDELNQKLDDKNHKLAELTKKIEELTQLKLGIESHKQFIDKFLQKNDSKAKEYQLNFKNILQVKVDYSSIDNLIESIKRELEEIKPYLESVELIEKTNRQEENDSLIYQIHQLKYEISTEVNQLTSAEKEFQQNVQKRKSINESIEELQGNSESPKPETLNFYKKEKEFIENELSHLLGEVKKIRIEKSLEIFEKKNEVIKLYNSFKSDVDSEIEKNKNLLEGYDIKIDSSFNLKKEFYKTFLGYINQRKKGSFQGAEEGEQKIKSIIEETGFNDKDAIQRLLTTIIESFEKDDGHIIDQVKEDNLKSLYNYIFSLEYITPKYELKLSEKALVQLSPGERGALLLIFYLMIDMESTPLIIDQPEDNLDNESVYNMLSKFIKQAKKKRQIIMVTHNPNLAVCADAEQIICVDIDKTNKNKFSFVSGSIENPEINNKIVQILEGTKPAFDKRKLKYQE